MEVIESRIDTSSDDYKANYEHMEKMVAELKAELKKAREDRSERAFKRNDELGKLPVQKRLDLLLDRNTSVAGDCAAGREGDVRRQGPWGRHSRA